MSEESVVYVRKLEDSAYPPGPAFPCRLSMLRWAIEHGYVVVERDPLPPPEPEVCATPKGVGGRAPWPAPPRFLRW